MYPTPYPQRYNMYIPLFLIDKQYWPILDQAVLFWSHQQYCSPCPKLVKNILPLKINIYAILTCSITSISNVRSIFLQQGFFIANNLNKKPIYIQYWYFIVSIYNENSIGHQHQRSKRGTVRGQFRIKYNQGAQPGFPDYRTYCQMHRIQVKVFNIYYLRLSTN